MPCCRPDLRHSEAPDLVIRVRFTARYNSRCGVCRGSILEGEQMGIAADETRVCAECLC